MTNEIEHRGDTAWIRADGDLDVATASWLERQMVAAEEEKGVSNVVLDLRSVRFLDSTGLRVVLASDARLRAGDRRLEIVRGPRTVQRVLQLALVEDRLHFREGETDDDPPPLDESSSVGPG